MNFYCTWWYIIIGGCVETENNPSLQTQVIAQASQSEIGQWDVVVTETVVISQDKDNQIDNNYNGN